jgi:hypothetical protein
VQRAFLTKKAAAVLLKRLKGIENEGIAFGDDINSPDM